MKIGQGLFFVEIGFAFHPFALFSVPGLEYAGNHVHVIFLQFLFLKADEIILLHVFESLGQIVHHLVIAADAVIFDAHEREYEYRVQSRSDVYAYFGESLHRIGIGQGDIINQPGDTKRRIARRHSEKDLKSPLLLRADFIEIAVAVNRCHVCSFIRR